LELLITMSSRPKGEISAGFEISPSVEMTAMSWKFPRIIEIYESLFCICCIYLFTLYRYMYIIAYRSIYRIASFYFKAFFYVQKFDKLIMEVNYP
jgi:hypothetical protein